MFYEFTALVNLFLIIFFTKTNKPHALNIISSTMLEYSRQVLIIKENILIMINVHNTFSNLAILSKHLYTEYVS